MVAVYDVHPISNSLTKVFSQILVGSDDLATTMSWNGALIALGFASGAVAILDWHNQLFHRFNPAPFPSAIRQVSFQPTLVMTPSPDGQQDLGTQKASSGFRFSPTPDGVNPSTSEGTAFVSPSTGMHLTSGQKVDGAGDCANRDEPPMISPPEAFIRAMVQQELSHLRREMHESLAELQVDLMQQLQLQKEAFNRVLSQNSQLLGQVVLENQLLRARLGHLQQVGPEEERTPGSLEAASGTREPFS
jgi:hypothetical protein